MTSAPRWLLGLAVLALAAPAAAANFAVDAFTDAVDADPGDGSCDDGTGACTLRAAVMEANALGGADRIDLPAGTAALSIPDNGVEDGGVAGDLDVQAGGLTIQGAGTLLSVIDAKNAKHRAFDTYGDLTLLDLAVIGGKVSAKNDPPGIGQGSGGCIRGRAELLLERVLVAGCSADPDGGGLAQLTGELSIVDSTLSNNKAKRDGGGVKLNPVLALVERSLIFDNSAGDEGGGVAIQGGFVDVVNTTLSGNSGKAEGGGILAEQGADLELVHVTFADNSAKKGAAIHVNDTLDPPSTRAANSIFYAKRKQGAANCQQSFATMITSLGGNVDNGASCGFAQATDRSNADPLLERLADNGGETLTHALAPASPAVGLAASNCEGEDQRGVGRPVPNGVGCDSGAFELP